MKKAPKSKPLTPQQVQFFHEEGYLIAPNVFDPADLEPVRQALHEAVGRKALELKAEGKLQKLHAKLDFDHQLAAIARDSEENGVALIRYLEGLRGGGFHATEMFDVIAHPKLLKAVSKLLGTAEIVASSVYRVRPKLPNFGRGVVPWHQDSGYFAAHCDKHMIITCWIPLVDANVENGCMQILPRTHEGKVATHHTGGNAGFLVIKDQDLPDDPRRAITAACPRGGVVFMTNRTPHCSTPNYSSHVRWSLDLRFQSLDVPNNVAAGKTARRRGLRGPEILRRRRHRLLSARGGLSRGQQEKPGAGQHLRGLRAPPGNLRPHETQVSPDPAMAVERAGQRRPPRRAVPRRESPDAD